jgi:glycosyltransferase involved in cell wall biosynthesis
VINSQTYNDLKEFYKNWNIDLIFFENVFLIKNFVNLPENYSDRIINDRLNILFVSRNSPEKRVNLVGKLASLVKQQNIGELTMIGADLVKGVDDVDQDNIRFLGGIQNEQELYKEYQNAHVFILLSTREGMPMTIMEAIANGCVIISTNVGGISFDVKNNINGFLIDSSKDDNQILMDCLTNIKELMNQNFFNKISKLNFEYAQVNFSKREFYEKYRKVILYQ